MLVKILKQILRPKGPAKPSSAHEPCEHNDEALIASAAAHGQRGELALAKELLSQVLARSPGNASAHDVLGNVLRGQDRLEEAITSYERALRVEPRMASARSNLAVCLRDLGRFEEARRHFEEAVRADPENPIIATNLAALLFDLGHIEEGLDRVETVLAQYPDHQTAHVVRGTRLLQRGDYARGWIGYEWRDRDAGRDVPDAFDYPLWDGSPMGDAHLLVCCEQGLGDQIMFASCFPDLAHVASRCIVECDGRLKALFARSFPDIRVFVQRRDREQAWLHEGLVPTAKTWMGSLPGRFRRRVDDFPHRSSYLKADTGKVTAWMERLQAIGTGPKIGISWRGGTVSTRRALRSIELNDWLPVLTCPGVHFVSLQYGDCGADLERVRDSAGISIPHWDEAIRDYDETAGLVCALDLVISVQTAVVHLAGALGRPTWVLIPSVAEWRYGESGERMPWYPSVRLYRQVSPGSWGEPMCEIRKALESVKIRVCGTRCRADGDR